VVQGVARIAHCIGSYKLYTRPRLGVERKRPIPLPAAAAEESLWEFENDLTLELTRRRFVHRKPMLKYTTCEIYNCDPHNNINICYALSRNYILLLDERRNKIKCIIWA